MIVTGITTKNSQQYVALYDKGHGVMLCRYQVPDTKAAYIRNTMRRHMGLKTIKVRGQ